LLSAELSEDDLASLLHKKATKVALNIFREYLNKKRLKVDLSAELKKFYAKGRKRMAICIPVFLNALFYQYYCDFYQI
jgi:hypothetical protein